MPVMWPMPRLICPLSTVTEPRPAKSVGIQPVSVLPSKSEPDAGNFPGVGVVGGAATGFGWLVCTGGAGLVAQPAHSSNTEADASAPLGNARSMGTIMPVI